MNFLGVATIPINGPCDAGAGRVQWLASKILPHESVVDLGGTGSMLKPWHQHVTALDDLSGFGKGHRLTADHFVRGDVCSLPFADDQFDVAVLAEVLEHVSEPWRAMQEAGRVANRVLITTPDEMRWETGIAFRVSGHLRWYTVDLLALHLRRAGLDGEIGLLEFGSPRWSFFICEVKRAG